MPAKAIGVPVEGGTAVGREVVNAINRQRVYGNTDIRTLEEIFNE